jgi:DNA polymerase-3 subunit gamma/tau
MEQATYRVLARSWRPQNFDELVGQGHVARTLTNAIESERMAHAYLFAGVRGTGKTTVARILAKCLNCVKGPAIRPCGACDPCLEIAAGNSLDVLELDAASRTKVDQTREMLEMVSYAPVRDRHKVFIIDEAHMLSKQSFAALLKTIEEPPPRVIFILATTELQKILPTILSRCQVFEFRRVGVADLTAHLRRIANAEGLTITDASLDRLARAGEGSVRDSLSLLERVIAFCGREIADDDVLRLLGAVRIDVLANFARALAARDAPAMLELLDAVAAEGHDLMHFWTELIGALRDLLLLGTLPGRADLLGRAAGEAELLVAAAEGLTRDDITRAFTLLADIEGALRSSTQPRYIFEATLIRLAALGAVRPIEEVLASLGGSPPHQAPLASVAAPPRTAAAPPLEKKKAKPKADPEAVIAAISEMPHPPAAPRREGAATPAAAGRAAAEARPPEPGPSDALLAVARAEPGVRELLDAFGARVVDIRPLALTPVDATEPDALHPGEETR